MARFPASRWISLSLGARVRYAYLGPGRALCDHGGLTSPPAARRRRAEDWLARVAAAWWAFRVTGAADVAIRAVVGFSCYRGVPRRDSRGASVGPSPGELGRRGRDGD